jgi:dipeptidyl aminopeptidase/acylaminoacyl peptidase
MAPQLALVRFGLATTVALAVATGAAGRPGPDAETRSQSATRPAETATPREPDFELMQRLQAETDRAWRDASAGFMHLEKIAYKSSADGLEIPAFVFHPLERRGPKEHPALVWVHENIRGHLYEHYIPFIRAATARGYVVIAPEYRGSVGYGRPLYDAIDYGGAEVDDVSTAVEVLKSRYDLVDPGRVGIIGWSHGGMIALLAVFRSPTLFKAAATLVPVTNLFHRLAWKGVDRQLDAIDPHDRLGGWPWERPEVYRARSPLFHVDKLQVPLLAHVADNDQDVTIEESMQLLDALQARKPELSETRIYRNPPGGHMFDRRVDLRTLQPENTRAQQDSWSRVWAFFDWHLEMSARDKAPR